MPLRPFTGIPYLPRLSIRPAEMLALEELPERDKDLLCPYLPLRPWTTAHHLESVLSRIEDAYGRRPIFVGLDSGFEEGARHVHEELEALRDPTGGYRAWIEFVSQHPNFIPSILLDEPEQLGPQARRLFGLRRGLLIPIPKGAFLRTAGIARVVGQNTEGGVDSCFMLDFEKAGRDLSERLIATLGYVRQIFDSAPNAYVSISASSFPDGFAGIDQQEIFERLFFNGLAAEVQEGRLIYGDRGSARAERTFGAGQIPPRIDYAERTRWTFFRSATVDGDRRTLYQDQATAAIQSDGWEQDLRLWGTQMIERTSEGDVTAITSQARATAVRINIHLHRQLFYDDPGAGMNTDEEWRD